MYDKSVDSPRPEANAVSATPTAAMSSVFALATVIKLAIVSPMHNESLRL